MKKSKRITISAIALAVIILLILQASIWINAREILHFNLDPKNYNAKLQIFDGDKKITELNVAVADDEKKQIYGLMNLKKLPMENGMLFVFFKQQIITMWMKDTLIPLDMIFIDENDVIVNIEKNTTPKSLDLIHSKYDAIKVLEVNASLTDKYKIKNGLKVHVSYSDLEFSK